MKSSFPKHDLRTWNCHRNGQFFGLALNTFRKTALRIYSHTVWFEKMVDSLLVSVSQHALQTYLPRPHHPLPLQLRVTQKWEYLRHQSFYRFLPRNSPALQINPAWQKHLQLRLFSVPTSGPQLVNQWLWYVLSCLWESAYKTSLAVYWKE